MARCLTLQGADTGTDEANANLISAAPELYEALKKIAVKANPENREAQWRIATARAALAKAEGVQP